VRAAVHQFQPPHRDVGVDRGRADRLVPEHLLDVPDVGAALLHECRRREAPYVAASALSQARHGQVTVKSLGEQVRPDRPAPAVPRGRPHHGAPRAPPGPPPGPPQSSRARADRHVARAPPLPLRMKMSSPFETRLSRTIGEADWAIPGYVWENCLSPWHYAASLPPFSCSSLAGVDLPSSECAWDHGPYAREAQVQPHPDCGKLTDRIHNRYSRTLTDIPWHGTAVRLRVQMRGFFCATSECGRRIFAERLSGTADRYARRTHRLTVTLHQGGLALGGETGSRLSRHLAIGVSSDTLLLPVRATSSRTRHPRFGCLPSMRGRTATV